MMKPHPLLLALRDIWVTRDESLQLEQVKAQIAAWQTEASVVISVLKLANLMQ